MDKKDELIDGLSPEELQREADEIRALIENAPEVKDAYVTDEMHERMMDRIRKYESEKAIANLSEEDREALRLGKELQNKKKKTRRPKKMKVWLTFAAALVMMCGMSISSVGGKNIIIEVLEKTFGTGDKTYMDSGEETIATERITEEQAYAEIKQVFGTKGIEIIYMPNDANFVDLQMDKELQEATLYYSVGNKIMSLRIVSRYVNSSMGIGTQDKLLQEYEITLPKTAIMVREYQIPETGEREYTAQFTYGDCEYFLMGIMKKAEFEKILKNLHFF